MLAQIFYHRQDLKGKGTQVPFMLATVFTRTEASCFLIVGLPLLLTPQRNVSQPFSIIASSGIFLDMIFPNWSSP